MHTERMKRAHLLLDPQLLDDVLRVSGERTYSRAVERALADFVRRARSRQILELQGSGLWEGELSELRADTTAPTRSYTKAPANSRRSRGAR